MAELVDRNITDAMIDAVGREAAKGRMLIVATTDLDDQETMLWNMGEIATSAPSADAFAAGNRALVLFGVPAANRQEVFRQMATLLLSYAMHNADFHAKNAALLYTSRADVHLAPAYDMTCHFVHGAEDVGPRQNPEKFYHRHFRPAATRADRHHRADRGRHGGNGP